MKFFTRTDTNVTKQTTKLFIEYAKTDKKRFLSFATLIPLGQVLEYVIVPLLFSMVVQVLVDNPHNITTALWLCAIVAGCVVISTIANHIGFINMFRHEERATTTLLSKGVDGILSHSQSYLINQKVGALAGDVNAFSRSYMIIFDTIFMQLSGTVVSFVISLVVIAVIAPILLIPLTALTAFVFIHSIRSLNKRAPVRTKRKELQSKLFGVVADIVGNHTLVRLYGNRDTEVQSVTTARDNIIEVFEQEVQIIQHESNVRRAVIYAFQIATIVLSILLFTKSLLAIGALVFVITYLGRVTSSMFTLTSGIRTIEQAYLDAAKTTELLMTARDVIDAPHAKKLQVSSADIVFRDVKFAYSDAPGQTVFQGLNITIPAGQHVGLVGHSGGGKTTLTSLLLRYADVTDGAILISNQAIADVTQASLRSAISYVPQDPTLFHRTLRENIAYGLPNASDKDIDRAVKLANAKEFIDELPYGLNTIVGERGVKLSGGQRQRIAIARAILKDAPILVLDEATSALDSESEKLIQQSLETLMKDRTSIVIAHRLSTIAKLDRIIVLDHGKIVEDGSHKQLLAQNGIYAKLWNHQSGGFIEE
jgi:ATP-binding cassette subfamily B protein